MINLKVKKYLLGLMAAVMTFITVSTMAKAETEDSDVEVYNLKVAGIEVTNKNAADILGDGTARYDLATNTLTLENANLHVEKPASGNTYGIRAEGSINIELKAKNEIYCKDYYGIAIVAATDASATNVTISGDGSLETYGSDAGLLVRGSLTIEDDVNISSKCGDVTSGSGYGIRVNDDLTVGGNAVVYGEAKSSPGTCYGVYAADQFVVTDNAVITGKAGKTNENSIGIASNDNFTASGNAKVYGEGGKGTERSTGLYAISNIYIKDNAQVEVVGEENLDADNYASESYGIRTTHMYITGGKLTTTGKSATGLSQGIYTQDFELSGGEVYAKSVNATKGQSIGIQSTKTLIVMGGTLVGTSSDTTQDSTGIDASTVLKVSGGEISATTGAGDMTCGIFAETAEITGGEIVVAAGKAENQSRGLQVLNDFSVSGGVFDIKAGDAEGRSFGLQTSTVLDITGGKISVETGKSAKSQGIQAWGGINITDATVEVTSQGDGLKVPGGSINLNAAINIDAVDYAVYARDGIRIDEKYTIQTPENGIITKVEMEEEAYSYISSEDGEIASDVILAHVDNDVDNDVNTEEKDDVEDTENTEDDEDVEDTENTENDEDVEVDENVEDDVDHSEKPEKNDTPKTGDGSLVCVWGILTIVSMGTIVFVRRKTRISKF